MIEKEENKIYSENKEDIINKHSEESESMDSGLKNRVVKGIEEEADSILQNYNYLYQKYLHVDILYQNEKLENEKLRQRIKELEEKNQINIKEDYFNF